MVVASVPVFMGGVSSLRECEFESSHRILYFCCAFGLIFEKTKS